MGVGRRIKEARENMGLTQEELGRRIGVTGSAITNYEKETSHPKEPIMYALMDALEVEPNFLFQDCVSALKNKKSPSTFDEDKLLECYRKLNEDGKEYIRQQMAIALQVYSGEYDNVSDLEAAK